MFLRASGLLAAALAIGSGAAWSADHDPADPASRETRDANAPVSHRDR